VHITVPLSEVIMGRRKELAGQTITIDGHRYTISLDGRDGAVILTGEPRGSRCKRLS